MGEWLASRASGVPPHLLERVRDALGPALSLPAERAPEECVAAAERVVAELLSHDRTGRDSALALLAADALVTFAFEAAADAPARLEARANAAMQALATLA
ncbi:MAG: hypothetical protein H0X64_08675 [Gemmatimonadaceae bacterium]|nr:hypothetical protein [Gemmatimonadaceae bacterium]